MSELRPHDNIDIQLAVAEMLEDCRANLDSHNSISGLTLQVGGVDWTVNYWVEINEGYPAISIFRDKIKQENPVLYKIFPAGYVKKNERIVKRIDGIPTPPNSKDEIFVEDENEVFTLRAIVKAAHYLKS